MAKVVRQYRYFNKEDLKNQPQDEISLETLENGSVFFTEKGLLSITQLGIQTLPGTKFYLNNEKKPIIIGATGIYELDLNGQGYIYSIRFDKNTLETYYTEDSATRLLIDIVYEGGNS
jgi:hypothetical protein